MAPNPRRIDARLQALYDRIPPIPACQGLCSDSCGPIRPSVSVREVERMERAAGQPLEPGMDAAVAAARGLCRSNDCSMLTEDRRCGVYDLRPMVCRLWGSVENLKCPYGCVPEGGWLPADEGLALLVESIEIGGAAPGQRDIANDDVRALFEDPLARQRLLRGSTELHMRPTLAGRTMPRTVIDR